MLSLFDRRGIGAIFVTLLTFSLASTSAAACTNESSPGFRAYLPDCRAYELVSPAYKEGFPVFAEGISEDGSQLRVESLGSFSDPRNISSVGATYLIGRSESGWESAPLDEPFSAFPVYEIQGMSSGFQSSLWFASAPGRSVRDVYLDPPGGNLVLIGAGAPPGAREGELNYIGASDDLRHVLLRDHSPAGKEENRLWPGDTTVKGQNRSLYEYEGTGNLEPRLVGVSNEERIEDAAQKAGKQHINEAASLISNCGTSLGGTEERDAFNAVSTNGATVFFTAEACGGSPTVNELYARIEGEKKVAISEPSKADCAACETFEGEPGKRSSALFQGASRDGSRVFFFSEQELLPGAKGNSLYEYEFHPEEDGRKKNEKVLLVAPELAPSREEPGGVARVSDDGSHVYFVAEGVLTGANGEGKSPIAGEPNMYVFASECPGGEAGCADRVDHTSFVATLSRGDEVDWSATDVRPVQATPNGRFVVFQGVADLTRDEEGRSDAGQIFEYDAEAEAVVRISRGENGYNEDGNTDTYPATIPVQLDRTTPEGRFKHLAVSEDGSRVFFSSSDALTPHALNGVCIRTEGEACVSYANNIYEYHAGQISLISDGQDLTSVSEIPAVELIETDESGRDVFFTTADSLVPQDGDTQVDIYDARESGGFALMGEPASCSGGGCRGATISPLSLPTSVTSTIAPEAVGSEPSPGVVVRTKTKVTSKKTGKSHGKAHSKKRKSKKKAKGKK